MPERPRIRRAQAREHRARFLGSRPARVIQRFATWPVLVGTVFTIGACAVSVLCETSLDYSVGQRIGQPILARVDFQVADPRKTAADREAARAAVPSYFRPTARELTVDRIRADLMRLYGLTAGAKTFAEYESALSAIGWPADEPAYQRLRGYVDQPQEAGRAQFEKLVESLPLEGEYVIRDWSKEPRTPASTKDFIILELPRAEGGSLKRSVPHAELIVQGNDRALRGSAMELARKAPVELRSTVEAIVLATFREQPTITYDQQRTLDEMNEAEKNTPPAFTRFAVGEPFINPGVLGAEDYELLQAERAAFREFLTLSTPAAAQARNQQRLRLFGVLALVVALSAGLFAYVGVYQARVLERRAHSVAFGLLVIGVILISVLLDLQWPQFPELIYTPCLIVAAIFAIVYPRRFALGAMCMVALLVTTIVRGELTFIVPLLIAGAVTVYQLDEVRARTKLIATGVVTSVCIIFAATAEGLAGGHPWRYSAQHGFWAGGCALLASFVISGLLPFIERLFRVATALTLLEWRDPTRPLLQLLAREAPGTYNHSLVLGTLAEAACERIGANGLLAQVGALYHDIGKIPKAEYFAENQQGGINRHDSLAPTMSLLIILGHVKDGLELAREFKLPRVLHQFIEEHHGTTVVRYFHHIAAEKQTYIATGRHDREVPEAEFRYPGPTPRTREAAVLMLCDGVEGAVRALQEPTVGRIETVVHEIVQDRLNDGQFDHCDITLREIRLVEESLVKTLAGIYHGRVAYPRGKRSPEEQTRRDRTPVAPAVG